MPIITALERMLAMRSFMRGKTINGAGDLSILTRVGLTEKTLNDMYKIMALADYDDRFVIPTNHREYAGKTPFDNDIAFDSRSACGFSFGNGCSGGESASLFGGPTHKNTLNGNVRKR